MNISKVSIHAPVWVRRLWIGSCWSVGVVSIHAPVWVRPAAWPISIPCNRVSIHAPVWVRLPRASSRRRYPRFQFTHPCGCDPWLPSDPPERRCFNSRTRVGATIASSFFIFFANVSIHAPVWVRPYQFTGFTPTNKFQFTHPCGCDDLRLGAGNGRSRFQFTHPCGCDFPIIKLIISLRSFNSRTRVGATKSGGPPGQS